MRQYVPLIMVSVGCVVIGAALYLSLSKPSEAPAFSESETTEESSSVGRGSPGHILSLVEELGSELSVDYTVDDSGEPEEGEQSFSSLFDYLGSTPQRREEALEVPELSPTAMVPLLFEPTIWEAPVGGGYSPRGERDEDLIILFPETPVLGPIVVRGYRNVVIQNGTMRLSDSYAGGVLGRTAAINFEDTYSGTKYIGNVTLDSSNWEGGAVLLSSIGARGAQPNIIIHKSSFTIHDEEVGVGFFRANTSMGWLRVEDFKGVTDHYGFLLHPISEAAPFAEASLKNVILSRSVLDSKSAKLIAVLGESGETTLRGITLEGVYLLPQKGVRLGRLVHPGDSALARGNNAVQLYTYEYKGAQAGKWLFETLYNTSAVVGRVEYSNPEPEEESEDTI